MLKTIKEFWLKWRMRVAEEKIKANTRFRKSLLKKHEKQVAKYESIRIELENMK